MSSDTPRTSDEYRAWWEENAPVPFGLCWCGCGQKTTIPTRTNRKIGRIKGKPMHFLSGHANRKGQVVSPDEYRRRWSEERPEVPFGYCWCGCGERTQVSPYTMTDRGWVKGEPRRYLHGHHGRILTEAHEPDIRRRYVAGESVGELAARFGCTQWSICNTLDKGGVTRRSRRDAAIRHACDDTYFDVVDTEEKAYWLGFIGADGCVVVKGNTQLLQVKLAARDAEHIFRLRDALRSDNLVYPLAPSPQDPRALQISSPGLVEGLFRHGVQPRKTSVYEWPDFLSKKLLRHYLRGYFDGDGSLSGTGRRAQFVVLGTEPFLRGCQDFMVEALGVGRTKLGARSGVFALTYGGRLQVARVARWLYADATIYLPRKRNKVVHLL